MPIGIISPTIQVLADRRVTTAELNWYVQELVAIVVMGIAMTTFWRLYEEATK